jgi:hypothetical protein
VVVTIDSVVFDLNSNGNVIGSTVPLDVFNLNVVSFSFGQVLPFSNSLQGVIFIIFSMTRGPSNIKDGVTSGIVHSLIVEV